MTGYLKIAGVALVAFALVAVVQRRVFELPVVGEYLPR